LAATIGLVVAYGAGAIALGTTPDASDDGPAVALWFRENGGHVRLWLWFGTIALVLFAVFAAFVRARLPEVYRDVFFVGAIGLVAETAVVSWIWGGLAWHAETLQPTTARTLLDVASYWGPVLTSATILMLAPVTLLALRAEAGLPRWLGYVTGIALVEQVVETVTIFGDRGFTAPGGPMNLMLGAGLTVIAFVSIGVVVARTMPS
jgi:hypothetical protein